MQRFLHFIGIDIRFNPAFSDYWQKLKTKISNLTDLLALEDTKKVVAEIKSHNEIVHRDFDDILAHPHLGPTYTPFEAICDGNYPQNSKSHSSQECCVTLMVWTGERKPKILNQNGFQIDTH